MKVVDLTHIINEDTPVFPGTEKPKLEKVCTMEKDHFREMLITMYSHTGTHMDAPGHMLVDGIFLDDFEVSKFFGKAVIIDCRNIKKDITKENLEKYKDKLDTVDFVLLNTGWDKKWGSDDYFLDFPALTKEAAEYLMEFELKGVGVDSISIDLFTSKTFEVHKTILSNNLVIIENLTNLDKLLDKEFTLSVLPLKLSQADGSPVRAVATLD